MISTDTNASLDAVAQAAYTAFNAFRADSHPHVNIVTWSELPEDYKTAWRVACHAAVGKYLVRL